MCDRATSADARSGSRGVLRHPELDCADGSRLILITAHHRENLGVPMKHMFRTIRRVMDEHSDVKAIYPIHMNSVVRDTTERPEGIKAGTLKLVGTDEESIYTEFKRLLIDKAAYDAMATASNPYGDGYACERITRVLTEK